MAWLADCRRLNRSNERKAAPFTGIARTFICHRRLAK